MSKFEDSHVMKSIPESCSCMFLFALCHVPLTTPQISSLPLHAHFCDVNVTVSPVPPWRHAAPKRQVQLRYAFNWSMNNPKTHDSPVSEVVVKSALTLFLKAPVKEWIWVRIMCKLPWLTVKPWRYVYWRLLACSMWCLSSALKMEAVFPPECPENFLQECL
jgi:hypothetical protein